MIFMVDAETTLPLTLILSLKGRGDWKKEEPGTK
jgi:hypothetical protein